MAVLGTGTLLSACSRSQIEAANVIRMGVSSRVRMLDPRKATDALSSRVNRLIYRSLIDFDSQFLPMPDLASWQTLSSTHYRFTLLEQPEFHHGKRLDASDVIATYQSVLNPDFGSAHRASFKGIERFEQISETQFDVFLKAPDALFIGRLNLGILPKDLIDSAHPFHTQPIGCGACEFVALSEQKLTLKRRVDSVNLAFIVVKDPTVRLLKLMNQEIDLLQNDLSPELAAYGAKQSGLKVEWFNGTNYGYIGFNFEDALLSQKAMRLALAHGINRQAVVDGLFAGQARLATGLLVPEHWAGTDALMQYEYDPQKAAGYFAQVKVPDELWQVDADGQRYIELTYKTSNDPTRIRLATIYQSQLKPLGIHLKIQSYDWGTFYNDIKAGRFQLYSLAWVGVKSPDIFQYVFASSAMPPNGANRGRFIDSKVDQLIDLAVQQTTLEEQAQSYRALQMRLHQELALMPLWFEAQYAVMQENIFGFQMFTDGRYDGLLTAKKAVKPL